MTIENSLDAAGHNAQTAGGQKQIPVWMQGLILAVLALVAYVPSLFNGFVWDDAPHVLLNPILRKPDGLARIWFHVEFQQYLPIQLTTYWIEYRLWGLNPLPYHALNILLHAAVGALLFRTLVRLQVPAPWLCAAVFLIHPVHVETAGYITERRNLLSALFYLSALLCWLRFEASGKTSWYAAALGFFLLALLSKTVACSLPVILILMRWMRGLPIRVRELMLMLPFFIVALPLALLTAYTEQFVIGARGYEWAFTFPQRLLICCHALWFYLGKDLWPTNLMFFYPRWNIDTADWSQWLYVAAAVGVALSLVPLTRRFGRKPATALAYFAITLFPALGFANIYPQRFSFVADHFQYMASIGVITLAVGALQCLLFSIQARFLTPEARGTIGLAAGSALLAALCAGLISREFAFKNDETVYADALGKCNDLWLPHMNLGVASFDRGEYQAAARHYEQSHRIYPRDIPVMTYLGETYVQLGKIAAARAIFQEAVAQSPAFEMAPRTVGRENLIKGKGFVTYYEISQIGATTDCLIALARLDARDKNWDHAYALLDRAHELSPHLVGPILARADFLNDSGHFEDALKACDAAAAVDPDSPEPAARMASFYETRQNLADAERLYRKALSLDPAHRASLERLSALLISQSKLDAAAEIISAALDRKQGTAQLELDLGFIEESKGDLNRAAEMYGKAIQREPKNAKAMSALGELCLKSGRNEAALELLRQALKIDPKLSSARENLGIALARAGAWDDAIGAFEQARSESPPSFALVLNLARALQSAHRYSDSVALLRESLSSDRFSPASGAQLKLELAWILSTCPDDSVRNGLVAERLARECLADSGDNIRALTVLAAAQAESGDFPAAVQTATKAIDAANQASKAPLIAQIREYRKLYESKRPSRVP